MGPEFFTVSLITLLPGISLMPSKTPQAIVPGMVLV